MGRWLGTVQGSSTLSQKGATAERQLVYTDKSYELSQHIRGNGCKLNILMHWIKHIPPACTGRWALCSCIWSIKILTDHLSTLRNRKLHVHVRVCVCACVCGVYVYMCMHVCGVCMCVCMCVGVSMHNCAFSAMQQWEQCAYVWISISVSLLVLELVYA